MTVAIVANVAKEGVKTHVPAFLTALERADISVRLHRDLKPVIGGGFPYYTEDTLFDHADMIVSFGGDGTILYTARISQGSGVPILGINLGKVGFLAECSPGDIAEIPPRLVAGEYEIQERMALSAQTNRGKGYFALNDIVIDRSADTRILHLAVVVNGVHAGDFAADGFIIATPTGSTAHSVSAGGPLVMPTCGAIVLTPICPHSLTLRPMIIDGSNELVLDVLEGEGRMAVDGQSFVSVPAGCRVVIRRNAEPVRIARFTDKTYFDILHKRLNWGVSPKLKNA